MHGFDVGRVLGTSARLFVRNFVPFMVLALLMYAPALGVRVLVPGEEWSVSRLGVGVLIDALIAATVTYGVIMDMHGTRPSYKDCVIIGLRQLPYVLGVIVLSLVAIGIGLVLLVVPGVIMALMVYVAVPVAVVERPGMMESLRRSRELTRGHKGAILGLLIAVWIIKLGFSRILGELFTATAMPYASTGAAAIGGVFAAVTTAVAYTALRSERDGVELPELATAVASVRQRPSR